VREATATVVELAGEWGRFLSSLAAFVREEGGIIEGDELMATWINTAYTVVGVDELPFGSMFNVQVLEFRLRGGIAYIKYAITTPPNEEHVQKPEFLVRYAVSSTTIIVELSEKDEKVVIAWNKTRGAKIYVKKSRLLPVYRARVTPLGIEVNIDNLAGKNQMYLFAKKLVEELEEQEKGWKNGESQVQG